MRVVILAPRATQDTESLRADAAATVIGWDEADIRVQAPARWTSAVRRVLGGGFVARIPLRLLGADAGTQFARRVRADAAAQRALSAAELIVAADEDAVFAAWKAGRASQRPARIVYGSAAAREVLTAKNKESS
ncbi:hypothetical protein [Microbacterium sp. W4I20]|uniref:hypothetical protein n=1 Tax=Microbacterium sp. W4I20 TaxID=3042262 RepID=UPI00278847CB|nr:hypothetical protein [Microbacterium sp. W4I20]MDQ0725930.1 hypothetical protein [Microbacterium sp. W4I20]